MAGRENDQRARGGMEHNGAWEDAGPGCIGRHTIVNCAALTPSAWLTPSAFGVDPVSIPFAGAAPVTRQSGRSCVVSMRRACNMFLRATLHLWADLSRAKAPWADT